MSLLRSGGVRLKPKLTLRSFSELSIVRTSANDGKADDRSEAEYAVLAQRVVSAMRRDGDRKPRGGQD